MSKRPSHPHVQSRRPKPLCALLVVAGLGCGGDGDTTGGDEAEQQAVVAQYITMVRANYDDTLETAKALAAAAQ